MITDPNFEKYKKLKDLLRFREYDIQMEKALAVDLCAVVFGYEISWQKAIGTFFLSMDTKPLAAGLRIPGVLFIDTNTRPDFEKFLQLVMANVPQKTHIHLTEPKLRPFLNLSLTLASIYFVLRSVGKFVTLKESVFLAARLTSYRRFAKNLMRESNQETFACKKLVSFNCSYGFEAVVSQACKSGGMETFTLTHGMSYTSHRKFIPADIINGENITVQNILVWGDSNKKELLQNFNVSPSRITSAGNLLYPKKEIVVRQTFSHGVILLGRKIYDAGNTEIIRIAGAVKKISGIKFSVRLHPSLSISHYSEMCKENNLELTDGAVGLKSMFEDGYYDFAIVNNSTTYYESMYHNMVCFRYAPDENEEYEGMEDKFSDQDSLVSQIDYFQKLDGRLLSEKVETLLKNNLGMGLNRYAEILSI